VYGETFIIYIFFNEFVAKKKDSENKGTENFPHRRPPTVIYEKTVIISTISSPFKKKKKKKL
jgi:hypothetical protein